MSASRDGDNSAIQKLIGKGVDIANTHFENWVSILYCLNWYQEFCVYVVQPDTVTLVSMGWSH